MVVERSQRRCLLCGSTFTGRAFVCRECADRHRGRSVPVDVLRRFYARVDQEYPEWANTYGNYNPPRGILKRLKSLPRESRVLELGAGGGFLLDELSHDGFTHLTGTDITATALSAIQTKNPAFNVVAADGMAFPFQNRSFDVLISSDVIEHLPSVHAHLSEVHRVLEPGGRYLFKTPNRRLALLYYRLQGMYDYHIWHPSMLSAHDALTLLESYGFLVHFLEIDELTAAQVRKVPSNLLRSIARRVPVRWLPTGLRPHLEIEAIRTT